MTRLDLTLAHGDGAGAVMLVSEKVLKERATII